MLDLKVAGGTLVFPDEGCAAGEIGLESGRIALIGSPGSLPEARQVVDARGLHVLPGVIDPHMHLGVRQPFADECASETRAALAAGVTTVCCFLRAPTAYAPLLPGLIAAVEANAATDVVFHATVGDHEQLAEMSALAGRFGITSFKMYLFGVPGLIASVDDGFLLDGFRAAATLGPKAVMCVHCENAAINLRAHRGLPARDGDLAQWAAANPDHSEAEAVRRAAFLSGVAGCRLYVVHLTSARALAELRRIRSRCAHVSVETTSEYLSLDVDDANGLALKRYPPVRTAADREALWQGVAERTIDTIGTDNVTARRAILQTERGVRDCQGGYANLPTHVANVLHHGVHLRHLPIERVAAALTREPARAFGLYPRKGALAVGGDGDLTLVDLDLVQAVDPRNWLSCGDWSPYTGRPLRGWSRITIRQGIVAARDGQVLPAAPGGRYLRRDM